MYKGGYFMHFTDINSNPMWESSQNIDRRTMKSQIANFEFGPLQ